MTAYRPVTTPRRAFASASQVAPFGGGEGYAGCAVVTLGGARYRLIHAISCSSFGSRRGRVARPRVTYDEYQRACERTVPPALTREGRLANFALGLGAEAAAEVLSITITQDERARWFESELGDCLWYIATLATTLGLRLEAIAPSQRPVPAKLDTRASACSLAITAGAVQEEIRRHLYHGEGLDRVEASLTEAIEHLLDLAAATGSSAEAVMARNMAKLRRRYP